MPTSTIPAFKAELATQLQALLPTVQVVYGGPWPMPELEWMWLADVEFDQQWATLGKKSRDETFSMQVLVYVEQPGNVSNQQAATERAYALMAVVETYLRGDPTVNGVLGQPGEAEVKGRGRLQEDANQEGTRVAWLQFTVTGKARI